MNQNVAEAQKDVTPKMDPSENSMVDDEGERIMVEEVSRKKMRMTESAGRPGAQKPEVHRASTPSNLAMEEGMGSKHGLHGRCHISDQQGNNWRLFRCPCHAVSRMGALKHPGLNAQVFMPVCSEVQLWDKLEKTPPSSVPVPRKVHNDGT